MHVYAVGEDEVMAVGRESKKKKEQQGTSRYQSECCTVADKTLFRAGGFVESEESRSTPRSMLSSQKRQLFALFLCCAVQHGSTLSVRLYQVL